MTGKGFGCVGVVERGRLDWHRHRWRSAPRDGAWSARPAGSCGDDGQPAAPSGRTHLAGDALWTMNEGQRRITSLFVVDGMGVPLGIVHVHDLLRAGVV